MNKVKFIIIVTLFFVVESCTNKQNNLNEAIKNVKLSFTDSLYFEINPDTISSTDPPQSLVFWYWSDSTIMFNIRPDSLNINGDRSWMAVDATPETGYTSIEYNGVKHKAIEYIAYSNGIKLGLKLSVADTSLAAISVISDSIPNIRPKTGVMIRRR